MRGGVEALLRTFSRLDRGRLPCELIDVEPGDEIELSRELVLSVFKTTHTVPSAWLLGLGATEEAEARVPVAQRTRDSRLATRRYRSECRNAYADSGLHGRHQSGRPR